MLNARRDWEMCMHDFETKDMRNMVRKVRITGGEVSCVDKWRIVEEFGCWMERWSGVGTGWRSKLDA